jgi:large repetitive protein
VAAGGLTNLGRVTYSKLRFFFAALAVALVTVTPALSAPSAPNLVGPADGQTVAFLPVFSWDPVSGADKYNFVVAADPLFNSPVYAISGTKNTRATPDKALPNGTYWWRVQAVDVDGNTSPWSAPQSIEKLWADTPTLTAPDDGATISYPSDPLVLRWDPVPGAAKYDIYIATDAGLSSLVTPSGEPLETQATNVAPALLLASNTYYWAVTPIDAQGNPGEQSEVRSFTWDWPSTTTPVVTDLADETELFDPEFTWDAIPGTAHYEVEVNFSSDFASGSKVCCTDKPIAPRLTPLEVFDNNTYYWRVRAVNSHGDAGVWNEGPPFVKTFDNYPDLSELAVKNLHMRDTSDPGTDLDGGTAGYQTELPIVTWDPVPGASSYQVQVVPLNGLGDCDWTASSLVRWLVPTASTSWTPLASGTSSNPPYPSPSGVSKDTPGLTVGASYCVRVRARSGRVNYSTPVYGDYTYLDDGTGHSFTFTGYPAGNACSPACNANYLGHDDYLLPIRGETSGANPLFIWNPIAGKQSYWVIVSKDPSFTTIVDYARTRIPAYAVRTQSAPRTYPDETTSYYWVVLPAPNVDGSGAPGNPSLGAYADFLKQSAPPDLVAPDDAASFPGQPTFQWAPTLGARRYHLQVANEPTFASPIDDVTTASTEFTALKTYASAKTLYWRVQAQDENGTGLTWSPTRTFEIDLPQPALDPATPTQGDASLPVLRWFPVDGAVSYTLQVQEPNSTSPKTYSGFPSTAASFEKITGTGIFTWKIRADFPKSSGTTPGPWSDPAEYTHTIKEPTNPVSSAGANRLVMSWDAKTGTKQYRVQVSKREDFSPYIESKTTDNPDYAPTLTSSNYTSGGTYYWRVAAIDGDGNVGTFANSPEQFTLPPISSGGGGGSTKQFKVTFSGRLVKNHYRDVTVKVRDSATLNAISGASVRAYGAGVSITTKTTNSSGVAKFHLKPTQLSKVTFRVSKTGYLTVYLNRTVRRS